MSVGSRREGAPFHTSTGAVGLVDSKPLEIVVPRVLSQVGRVGIDSASSLCSVGHLATSTKLARSTQQLL